MRRIDAAATKLAISLAFASGVSGGLFGDALDRATVAPSTWEPRSFASDLFLASFVQRCFTIRHGTEEAALSRHHLTNLLANPPADVAVVHHRRAIVAELAGSPALRRELDKLYQAICRLRTLLEGATGIGKWDANRRQLDILVVVKEILDGMAGGFGEARSGLARLAAFGRRVQAEEPYRSLADLLRYDEELATLTSRSRSAPTDASAPSRCSRCRRTRRTPS